MHDTTETKQCRDCGEVKPLSEYYLYSQTQKSNTICKECARVYQANYYKTKGRDRYESSIRHERMLIDVLRSRGIFAVAGKQTRYANTDVVAWGCVSIEAKLADSSGYRIAFSRQQIKQGVRAEIIAVIIPAGNAFEFYIAPANHPMFIRKTRLSVHPNPTKPSLSIFSQLKEYRDNWGIIEEYRLRIAAELQTGGQ